MLTRRLAAFVMSGRWQAVVAAVLLAVAGVLFPPLALISAAVVALVTLRHGFDQGLIVLGWGGAAIAALAALLLGAPLTGVIYAVAQWLPVLLFAQLLRGSASWATVMTVLAAVGLAIVLGVHLLVPDTAQVWTELLQRNLGELFKRAGMGPAEVTATIARAAHYATGAFAMSLVLSVSLSLMLARAWQASLYNPGGFRDEYTRWRLGVVLAGFAALLVVLILVMHNALLVELAMVVLTPFLLQAIGLLHGLVRQGGMSVGWLVGLYVLLFLAPPQMGSLLAAVGVVDSFADLRTRFRRGD
ncbi:hypothetical protein [Acidihalobacter prosperus]|uniref:DUF2232 domain-containing protein n=1 Tax=Acidihalobacter prosperus TaxID=160660 RepID=A0A1A6C2F3_9GAMM|nr:hypothetical protein [Acidihalobacter prosperus]OBS08729.1 hypothetical protein Thpro_022979 [Acidihalobacter prosperus]